MAAPERPEGDRLTRKRDSQLCQCCQQIHDEKTEPATEFHVMGATGDLTKAVGGRGVNASLEQFKEKGMRGVPESKHRLLF